jgi:predicted dehydrogenase
MKRIKLAIVGCGSWAQETHLPYLLAQPFVDIVGIVDITADTNRQELAKRYSPSLLVSSLDDLLAKTAIDCAVISTPHATHFEIATQAVKRGVHVHVDKPLCSTVAEVKQLLRLAKEKQIIISTHTQRKYMVGIAQMRGLLQSKFTEVYHVSASLWQPVFEDFIGSWRSNKVLAAGGILMDSGYHLVDSILFLLSVRASKQVSNISALAHYANHPNDAFATLLFRANKSVVQINAFRGAPKTIKKEEYHVFGDGGYIKMSFGSNLSKKCRVSFWDSTGNSFSSKLLYVNPSYRVEPLKTFLNALMGNPEAKEIVRENVNLAMLSLGVLENAYALDAFGG